MKDLEKIQIMHIWTKKCLSTSQIESFITSVAHTEFQIKGHSSVKKSYKSQDLRHIKFILED